MDFNCAVVAHERDAAALENGDIIRTAAHWYGTTMKPLTGDLNRDRERIHRRLSE